MHLLSPAQVLEETRGAFGLAQSKDGSAVDETLLAQLLRAAAWSYCPCQAFVLVREVERQLIGLVEEAIGLRDRIAEVLETLVATGDLVEPGLVSHSMELPKGALFAAPLSFSMLNEGVAQIFGIACTGELESKPEMQLRVVHEGASRRVYARSSEQLAGVLRHAGLREISVQAWLKEPGVEGAGDFLNHAKSALKRADPADSATEGLEVFDATRGAIYADCWGPAVGRNGSFIARRPKAYGNSHWMLVEMADGRIARCAHLPLIGSTNRACDEAWRLQCALGAVNGQHQQYRLRKQGADAYIDMLFPVPLWAHRHLLAMGRQVPRYRSICSYHVPENLLSEVRTFLEQKLWMKTKD